MIYVSLHGHSTFSYGDGFEMPVQHVKRAHELGMSKIALSEHGNVSSWVALEIACDKYDIKPIFGIEIYISVPKQMRKCHMILLAMDEIGIYNINQIVTKSYQQFYRYPTVYWEDLKKYHAGIIALSGCADSQLSCILLGGKYFGEKRLEPSERDFQRGINGVERFQDLFGDRYYLEVQRFPGLPRTCALNPILSEISKRTRAQLAATSDVHYPYPHQNALQRILHASHRGGTVETADADWEYGILLTYPESDLEIYKDLRKTGLDKNSAKIAIDNTAIIANRCDVRLPKAALPRYQQSENDWEPWI